MSSPLSEHPEAARLTIRVGVTGHRPAALAALGADPSRLRAETANILAVVRRIAWEIQREAAGSYTEEAPQLRVISSLAEGSDRMVVEEALALCYEPQYVLPFARGEYEKDFASAESRQQFHRLLGESGERGAAVLELVLDPGERPSAYRDAGRALLLQCDLLIAIWDGSPAKGEGGTGDVVKDSLRLEIPTVWVDARPDHGSCLLQPGLRPGPPPKQHWALGELGRLVRGLFLPPPVSANQRHVASGPSRRERFSLLPPSTTDQARFHRFLGEKRPRWNFGIGFQLFRYLWTGNWRRLEVLGLSDLRLALPRCTTADWEGLPAKEAIESGYLKHFGWADSLAESYGGRYRSSFLFAYLLGAAAVLFAFLGATFEKYATLWFSCELAVILLVLLITIIGRRQCWHERWMDYRLLAEALRQMEFLAPLGRVPASVNVPAYLRAGDPRRSWFNWHFRALVRQAGIVPVRLDRAQLDICCRILGERITEQARYHSDNHLNFERLHRRPHVAAQMLFGLAAIACVLHLTRDLARELSFPPAILSLCAVVLPAVGAALAAILHQGEFERIALRSQALHERLEELATELAASEPTLLQLGRIADVFSDLSMAELVDWRFVFLDKNLVLPA